jgi:hypothetical protein
MNKLIAVALSTLFAAGVALARHPPPKPAEAAKAAPAAACPPSLPRSRQARRRPAAAPAAANDCEAKAVSKDGKPLAGAAKAAFMKKCGDAKPAAKAK